jgi:hypothetical protein
VGKGEAVGIQLDLAEKQQVDVDRTGSVAGAAEGAPVLRLDGLADIEQLLRLERGPDPDGRIKEIRLVEELADRLRFIQRGDGLDLYVMPAQVLYRAAQLGLAVADIRAEAEIANAAPLGQTPSSSSDSRSRERSRVTSTAAS